MFEENTLVKCLSLPLPKTCGPMIGARVFWRNNKGEFIIWSEEWIYIFNVKANLDIVPSPYKAVKAPNTEDIFLASVDEEGSLVCLNSSGSLDFLHIFTSANVAGGNCGNLRPLYPDVLAVCTNKEGLLCLLRKKENDLVLMSCSVKRTDSKIYSSICIGPKSCMDLVGQCCIYFLSGASLTDTLRCQLFPSLEDGCDLVIACLGSGRVLCVPFINNLSTYRPHLIFSSHSRVTSVLPSHENPVEALHLFLANNCMIKISAGESQLNSETVPCKSTRVVCSTSTSSVLLSDKNHAWLIKLDDLSNELSLPVRGILSACEAKPNQIFVTTRHQSIYLINLSAASRYVPRSLDKMDSYESVLKCIDKTAQEISEVEKSISNEDILLREISLMQRASLFQNKFELSVTIHDSENFNYNFDVRILNNSGISLGPKLWCMHVKIIGKEICASKSQILLKSFEPRDIFRLIIECHLENLILPMSVECKLISLLPFPGSTTDQDQWCTLPVGSIKLDVSYFMNPISSALNVQEYGIFETESNQEQVHTCRLILKAGLGIDDVVKKLTITCSHRMTALRNSSTLAFKIHKSKVKLQVDNNEIVIVSSDKDILMQVHRYLKIQLSDLGTALPSTVFVNPAIPLKVEALRLAVDLAKIEGSSTEDAAICSLHETLRQSITSCLPEPH